MFSILCPQHSMEKFTCFSLAPHPRMPNQYPLTEASSTSTSQASGNNTVTHKLAKFAQQPIRDTPLHTKHLETRYTEIWPLSDSKAGGHCFELCLCPQQRVVRLWFNDGKHLMHIFGPCLCNTRKWKQIFDRRNALERINARVGRDFLLNNHFLRGKFAMHLRIAGNMVVMLAIALGCMEKNKPDKKCSLVTPPAA